MARLTFHPALRRTIRNGAWHGTTREDRLGVMLHFDASASDEGAMAWFQDPRCRVSYNYLVLDDGSYVEIAPLDARAWHAGVCRPSRDDLTYRDANSAFYGIAAATNLKRSVTGLQLLTIAYLVRKLFQKNNWNPLDVWRIVGHSDECWPRGRKVDPVGLDPDRPILSVEAVRNLAPMIVI